jgi:hypothetical protein
MNREQARNLIQKTFTQKFDKTRFLNFTRNLLNHIDEFKASSWNNQYVKDAFKPHVQRYERLGTYHTPNKEAVDLLVVYLTAESKLERARTAIRNFVADHLKTRDEKDAALVAFVAASASTWRFSYVKMEYATVQSESGNVGVEARLTPARRFSYIVGEGESCHTAQTRFVDLLQNTGADPTLSDIENAFSVEAVTKEFFIKYAELFEEIHKSLDRLVAKEKAVRDEFTNKAVNTADLSKKLMGQIVFLYFLQKKGWLGVGKGERWGAGPRDFLRRLARGDYGKYDNFFNDVLEPLFYDTLATDRGHEAWCDHFKCRIPFLNGGLFEPLGDYDWQETDVALPNKLFTNSTYIDEGVIGDGVLDVFDRYNFTVNEAEPLEKEVAIDPEMLGKVFENLIEENLRKGLGAYYTPREIVHYMCQDSLISYLDTALNKDATLVPSAEIKTFVHLGEQISHYEAVDAKYPINMPKSIQKHARLMDEKLANITVCDPAVGSGAFPVGMMTEIVRARCALTPYFNDFRERTPYHFKRQAIQNCLYGVDIDGGAVEIAKLRLWLSLVVDEEDVEHINPLPNLDFKIVTGNSLYGFPFKSEGLSSLEKIKQQYFDETDHHRKTELKHKIEKHIHDLLANSEKALGYRVEFDFQLYFSEVFDRRLGGFDIIIGNPPYLRIQNIAAREAAILKSVFKSASGKFDIYVLFVEKSLQLIRPKGVTFFIHPHRFLTADYGRGLKRVLDLQRALKSAILFGVNQVFETSTTYTGIFCYSEGNSSFRFKHANDRDFQTGPYMQRVYTEDGSHWVALAEQGSSSDLIAKLSTQTRKMSDIFEGILQGIVTVGDDIFVFEGKVKDNRFTGSSGAVTNTVTLEADIVKPLLKGENIRRYSRPFSDLFILYPHYKDENGKTHPYTENQFRTQFPLAFEYIRPFKTALVKKKIQYKTNPKFWFALHRSREIATFESEKLLTPQLQNCPHFTLDSKRWYPDAGGYSLVRRKNAPEDYRFLLGIMNSSVLWYFIRNTSNAYNNNYYYFKTKYLEKFSLPEVSSEKQAKIIGLVDEILHAKAVDPAADTAGSEAAIDAAVCELYGLTAAEIELVNYGKTLSATEAANAATPE